MAGKIRKSNLHNDVKTMVTDMISEQALDSANFDSVLSGLIQILVPVDHSRAM